MQPMDESLTDSDAPTALVLEVRQSWFAERGIARGAEAGDGGVRSRPGGPLTPLRGERPRSRQPSASSNAVASASTSLPSL